MQENETTADDAAPKPPRTALFRVLAGVLVGAEGLVVVGAAVWLAVSLFTAPAASLVSAVALLVLVAIGAVGVCAMAIGILRGQRWARSGGIVVQILLLAVAVGAATGQFAHPSVGLALGVPALVTLVLIIAAAWGTDRDARAEDAAR